MRFNTINQLEKLNVNDISLLNYITSRYADLTGLMQKTDLGGTTTRKPRIQTTFSAINEPHKELVPDIISMRHPSQETLDSKAVSAMFTTAVLSLVGKPIIGLSRQSIVFKCLNQRIVIINTANQLTFLTVIPHRTSNDLSNSRNKDIG
jgi:hypothetical protein